MRIGILGQTCIDENIHPGRASVLSVGGVLYSYAAMERLMEEGSSSDDSYVPSTWFSKPDRSLLYLILSKFRYMDRSLGLWETQSQSNRVQLVYHKDGERSEHCPHILPPITNTELTPNLLESLDALFVNMISGFDVSSNTLETALNSTSKRPYVHLDIHALVLGPLSSPSEGSKFGGGRTPQGVCDWK